MKSRNYGKFLINATGTVFLAASVFFVFSTVLSVRMVLAEVMPQAVQVMTYNPSPRTTASPRATTSAITARGAVNNSRGVATTSRSVASRSAIAPNTTTATSANRTVNSVASRSTSPRTTSNKNVVSRAAVTTPTVNTSRSVASRVAAVPADANVQSRISLQGSAIRSGSASTIYTYAPTTGTTYTNTTSNIVDPTTGLISADAYANCMDSYYACMDEICTARNAAQRRCACAGRVKAFASAEADLERSNEELIKVSGELALLVSTKGKDVSAAFQLTDAEKVMNCVSWQDASKNGTGWRDGEDQWCEEHAIFDNSCSETQAPTYCKDNVEGGNNFGFDIDNLDAAGSDILASLQSWADAKEETLTITKNDDSNLFLAFEDMDSVLGGLTDVFGNVSSDELVDSLAETWGYELFEYAHNNVCNRVLDSCFNGIYEACGTPSGDKQCTNGQTTCPYNYNTMIDVNNTGTYELEFVTGNSGSITSTTASCYGYSTSDPYVNLRGPIADARRSILQKYALDANADCDAYGDQLKTTATNIGYQKVAAQQALQEMRLEFAMDEAEETKTAALNAGEAFNECISEIYDCYITQDTANPTWSTSRIKTYCAQVSNVPSCYETMICNPSYSTFYAVIDKPDSPTCDVSQDPETNTCRNVVALTEILNGVNGASTSPSPDSTNSKDIREYCLLEALGDDVDSVRNWESTP